MPGSFERDQDLLADFQWLIGHPEFEERPPGIVEFLGPEYLNIRKNIRKRILAELEEIFGDEFVPGQIARYAEALITGGIGIGKGGLADDHVATPKGWRQYRDLAVGDEVLGSDGRPTAVTGVFPRGVIPVYRVQFNDRTSVVVDGDHLWNVKRPDTAREPRHWQTLSTRDLMERGTRKSNGQRRWHIPVMSAPAEFEGSDLPVAPYTLGALLGDGGLTQGTVILSTADPEILGRLLAENPTLHATHRSGVDYRLVTPRGQSNPLLTALRALDVCHLAHVKRVPAQYMTARVQDRLDLLRGLLDTDGYAFSAFNHIGFTSSSPGLAEDVAQLVRSLGGTARVTVKATTGRDCYVVAINCPMNPFWVPRKADIYRQREKYKPARMIDSITPVGEAEVICIAVAAADQLYVTENYTVTHNTTIASIVLSYMACCTLCLKDPQEYYKLLPGSKIAFMMMSTKRQQALEVIFQDTKARIDNSKWFKSRHPRDDAYKNLISFPKNISIIPGDSLETTFEGYNILGGVMDEIDSHKLTTAKDYAESGYSTIRARITSRFGTQGFLVLIGQTKTEGGFAMRRMDEFSIRDDAYAVKLAIWESLDDSNFCGQTFFYDTLRSTIMHADEFIKNGFVTGPNYIEIPVEYIKDFRLDPDKALRDLAGIPRKVEDPFIRNVDKIMSAVKRYTDAHPGFLPWHNRNGALRMATLDPALRCDDGLPRVGHIDIAYSPDTGDAAAVCVGHISDYVETEEGLKPYIKIDVLCRILPPAGRQLEIQEIRDVVYQLVDRGYKIKKITLDGFQCFTGDVKISLLDGRALTMREMAEQYPEGGVSVYSYDGAKIVPGQVTKAWRTGTKRVVRVLLDNGEVVRCTPDHRWMLRDGSYREASQLTPGMSLMPLYRDVTPDDWKGLRGYERVWQPRDGARGGRKWQFTHRMAFDKFRKTFDPAVKIRNHKVVAVLDEGEVEDVYDLTVADHHNFALDAGVFVHNSTDTMQQFRKRHIFSDLLSVDKKMLPYSDLRDAIYEERIEFPPVMGRQKRSEPQDYDIIVKELTELGYPQHGEKIDHPHGGTKDCADALAGTVHNLMLRARKGRVTAPEATGTKSMDSAMRNPVHNLGTPSPLGGMGLSPILTPYRQPR